jgi:hypothetical protein
MKIWKVITGDVGYAEADLTSGGLQLINFSSLLSEPEQLNKLLKPVSLQYDSV